MVDRASIAAALNRGIAPYGFLDEADERVDNHYDFRGTAAPAGWTERGSGHTYSETNGFLPGASASIQLLNYDDTNIIGQGTILIEFQRAALGFNSLADGTGSFEDAFGRSESETNYLLRINEDGGFARELHVYRNGVGGGTVVQMAEGATDDTTQPMRFFDHPTPDPLIDDEWCILAVTWRSGRTYFMFDGCVTASFQQSIVDGDIHDILLGGSSSGTTTLGDYYIRRMQVRTDCVAPHISGPKIAVIGDSFTVRSTSRDAQLAETVAAYWDEQSAVAYAWAEPPVPLANRYTERVGLTWGQTDFMIQLQKIAYVNYGIFPPIFNAGANGRVWRSDISGATQINGAQTASVIDYDPEILWCIGSVNDINLADTVDDIVTDIKALINTMVAGCRNIRKVYFVETFSTSLTVATNNTEAHKAEDARLRAKLPQLDGYTVTNAAGIDVSVEFVPTWSEWAPDGVASARYGIGSHPQNETASVPTPTVNGDVHLTAEGSAKVAEILRAKFLADLVSRP